MCLQTADVCVHLVSEDSEMWLKIPKKLVGESQVEIILSHILIPRSKFNSRAQNTCLIVICDCIWLANMSVTQLSIARFFLLICFHWDYITIDAFTARRVSSSAAAVAYLYRPLDYCSVHAE